MGSDSSFSSSPCSSASSHASARACFRSRVQPSTSKMALSGEVLRSPSACCWCVSSGGQPCRLPSCAQARTRAARVLAMQPSKEKIRPDASSGLCTWRWRVAPWCCSRSFRVSTSRRRGSPGRNCRKPSPHSDPTGVVFCKSVYSRRAAGEAFTGVPRSSESLLKLFCAAEHETVRFGTLPWHVNLCVVQLRTFRWAMCSWQLGPGLLTARCTWDCILTY
mmetsp:Transcript_29317/g.64918  ORF Transcript_29317/g.64918 Transcript_29317/m.64918 type:complete len:220 (-) Transcript_29317:74-733(-)